MTSALKNEILYEAAAREDDYNAALEADRAERMEAFDNGFVSLGAAIGGGDAYAFEMRESAREDALANPVTLAVAGWFKSYKVAA